MAEENQTEHVEAIAVPANALEQIERASIDIQIATAKQYPRSMDLFYKRATAMVTFDAETAGSCLYCRPVGKEKNAKGQWVEKYAEGESIRLAEIVAASFGYIRVAGRITEMEPRHVKAQGVAFDLETNTAYTAEVVESTVTKQGVPFSERMRIVVAKSAQSKAIRDAIFRIIPKSLCKSLVIKAKEVAKGDAKTFESRRKAVVEWIKSLKIDAERVWNAIGIKGEADITIEVLLLLHGLKTAIEEGDCTINEAFPKPEAEQAGSTADRIKDKFEKSDEADKEEKPTEKPKEKGKGKSKGKGGTTTKKEAKPQPEKEPEPTPTEETKPEPEPEKETVLPDKWKCMRCDRLLKDNGEDVKGDLCAYCTGKIAELT